MSFQLFVRWTLKNFSWIFVSQVCNKNPQFDLAADCRLRLEGLKWVQKAAAVHFLYPPRGLHFKLLIYALFIDNFLIKFYHNRHSQVAAAKLTQKYEKSTFHCAATCWRLPKIPSRPRAHWLKQPSSSLCANETTCEHDKFLFFTSRCCCWGRSYPKHTQLSRERETMSRERIMSERKTYFYIWELFWR